MFESPSFLFKNALFGDFFCLKNKNAFIFFFSMFKFPFEIDLFPYIAWKLNAFHVHSD